MNQQLIAACEEGSPMCSPKAVAELLSLDYCPGECGGPSSSKTKWIVGAAAAAVVLALVLRKK